MDTFVENDCGKCIGCKACCVICPERSVYITTLELHDKKTYHTHFKKEKQYCEKCIKTNGYAPCVEICPEESMKIISR